MLSSDFDTCLFWLTHFAMYISPRPVDVLSIQNTYKQDAATIHADILRKLAEIKDKYQDYPSYQHAAWIIEEEYREFCAELFKKDSEWDYTKIYKELIDIMAACYRTIIDRDLLSHVKESAENTEES